MPPGDFGTSISVTASQAETTKGEKVVYFSYPQPGEPYVDHEGIPHPVTRTVGFLLPQDPDVYFDVMMILAGSDITEWERQLARIIPRSNYIVPDEAGSIQPQPAIAITVASECYARLHVGHDQTKVVLRSPCKKYELKFDRERGLTSISMPHLEGASPFWNTEKELTQYCLAIFMCKEVNAEVEPDENTLSAAREEIGKLENKPWQLGGVTKRKEDAAQYGQAALDFTSWNPHKDNGKGDDNDDGDVPGWRSNPSSPRRPVLPSLCSA